MKEDNNPIVSVIVITYNSSSYVLETLESIKNQTYNNLEIIVSDDKSSDSTLDIVNDWIKNNKRRFTRTEVICPDHNTGVTANYNRAINACNGEWVKNVDGDDILLPSCIEDNIEYVRENPDAQIVLSDSIVFFNDGRAEEKQKPGMGINDFFSLSALEQFEELKKKDVILNPNSQFAKTRLIKEIGYDERIKSMEDRPFLWNCLAKGYKFYYMNKSTVKYRKYEGSLTGLAGKKLMSLGYGDSLATFYYLIKKPIMEESQLDISRDEKRIMWYLIVKYVLKNKGNILTRFIYKVVQRFYL